MLHQMRTSPKGSMIVGRVFHAADDHGLRETW